MDLWEFPHKAQISNVSEEICALLPCSKGEEQLLQEALYSISTSVDSHSQVIWELILKLKCRLEESQNETNFLWERQQMLVQENLKLVNMLHKIKSELNEHVRQPKTQLVPMNDIVPLKLKKRLLSIIKNKSKNDSDFNTFIDKDHYPTSEEEEFEREEEIEETSKNVTFSPVAEVYEDESYIDESCAEDDIEDEEYDIEYGDELDDLDEEDFLQHTPRRTKKGKKIKSITKNARARQNKNDRRFRLKKSMLTCKELNAFDIAKEFKDQSIQLENTIDDLTSEFRSYPGNYHDVTILR